MVELGLICFQSSGSVAHFFPPTFRYCNKIQEKRSAVYDKVVAVQKEIQQNRLKIHQLNENAEKEEMKVKVRLFYFRTLACCSHT